MDEKYKDIGKPAIVLIEEASELIKAVTKLERFGPMSWNPYKQPKVTNLEALTQEWNDLRTRYDEYLLHVICTLEKSRE